MATFMPTDDSGSSSRGTGSRQSLRAEIARALADAFLRRYKVTWAAYVAALLVIAEELCRPVREGSTVRNR